MFKEIRLAALTLLMPLCSRISFCIFDFFLKTLCRNPVCSLPHDDNLLKSIRGRNRHLILPSDLMDCLFDVLIRRFRFPGIHNINIVVGKNLLHMPLNLVGIKDQDQCTFTITLIITQDILELITGRMNIFFCQLIQFFPGKNNIVSIYKKIFFFTGPALSVTYCRCCGMYRFFLECCPLMFYRTEGSLKDRLKFFLLFIASAVRKFSVFSTTVPGFSAQSTSSYQLSPLISSNASPLFRCM